MFIKEQERKRQKDGDAPDGHSILAVNVETRQTPSRFTIAREPRIAQPDIASFNISLPGEPVIHHKAM